MAGWTKLKTTEKNYGMAKFVDEYLVDQGVSFPDLALAIASLGISVVAGYFFGFFSQNMAKAINASGVGLSVASILSLLKSESTKRAEEALKKAAANNNKYMKVVTETWIYEAYSGDSYTWKTESYFTPY